MLLSWGDFAPRPPLGTHLAVSGGILGCHAGLEDAVAAGDWAPGMLPNTPQCTGYPTSESGPAAPDAHSAGLGRLGEDVITLQLPRYSWL